MSTLPPDPTRDAILQWLRSAAFLFQPSAAEVMELIAQNVEAGTYIRTPKTPPVTQHPVAHVEFRGTATRAQADDLLARWEHAYAQVAIHEPL